MSNIIDYIKKYGDKTFYEEEFNEIDNLVFCAISYLNFSGIVEKGKKTITLNETGKLYLNQNEFKDTIKYGVAKMNGYKVLKSVVDSIRYKDVLVYGYLYDSNIDKQFGAISFKLKKDLIYIAFEGTDHLLSGWKEDFQMSYKFPVPAQKCAIDYLNKYISIFDRNIIVGGHSKGGNLALISSMYCNKLLRMKIKKIYSNDGPGVRKEQINSKNYKKIKDRYVHIIPDHSYFGVLLRNDKYDVIKSSKKDILCHSILTWQIEDKNLVRTEQSVFSKNLEKSIIMWLDEHDDMKRKKMIEGVFKALEDSNIYETKDIVDIRKSIKVIKNLNNIDEETKDLAINFLQFNLNYILNNR